MIKKSLIEWIYINLFDRKGRIKGEFKKVIENNPNVKNLIFKYTIEVLQDRKTTLSERLYCIVNDLQEIPVCPICESNYLVYHGFKEGYRPTCSNKECRKLNFSNKIKGRHSSIETRQKQSQSLKNKNYKGKTWEERYGEKKANSMKKNFIESRKRLTWDIIYKDDEEAYEKRKQQASEVMKNNNVKYYEEWQRFREKNYNERYGEERAKLIAKKIGQSNSKKVRSEEFKSYISKKARQQRVIEMKNNYGISFPAYNKKACEFFKLMDKLLCTQGRYAVYGGGEWLIEELGYWPDYINHELKLIIEWDEEGHYDQNGNLKEKDIKRQKEIQEYFYNYIFVRVREKDLSSFSNEIDKFILLLK